jgi:hypothetical protein
MKVCQVRNAEVTCEIVRDERVIQMLAKPNAWTSGWASAILCLSAASGYWLAGEHRRAICWAALGAVEVAAIVF